MEGIVALILLSLYLKVKTPSVIPPRDAWLKLNLSYSLKPNATNYVVCFLDKEGRSDKFDAKVDCFAWEKVVLKSKQKSVRTQEPVKLQHFILKLRLIMTSR